MKESNLYKYILSIIVVVALGAPAIASADAKSQLQGVSVKVSYADLNLEKQAGAKTLYRRLRLAARQACDVGSLQQEGSVRRLTEARQCYSNALSKAVEELDNQFLTQIHNS
jgi:UrcA family protein